MNENTIKKNLAGVLGFSNNLNGGMYSLRFLLRTDFSYRF